MKYEADVNASTRSTAAARDELCDRDSWNPWGLGGPGGCNAALYVRVISRPYRGRFTTAPGPRSVLGTSRSCRKVRKSACPARFYPRIHDHRSRIRRIVFATVLWPRGVSRSELLIHRASALTFPPPLSHLPLGPVNPQSRDYFGQRIILVKTFTHFFSAVRVKIQIYATRCLLAAEKSTNLVVELERLIRHRVFPVHL